MENVLRKDEDVLMIGDERFTSRFFLGSGKTSRYSKALIETAVQNAGVEWISIAVSAVDEPESGMEFIPPEVRILPNTLGAGNVAEAVRLAHMAREWGMGDYIKLEIMNDFKYLLPDNPATVEATKILVGEGFRVLPYIYPDIDTATQLYNAGATALMPLASPSGSGGGLKTRDFIKILLNEIPLPIIVDAGIGRPSEACAAMEMGCAAVMANTALSTAGNLPLMAEAFRKAVQAGRDAYLSSMQEIQGRHVHPYSV